MSGAAMHTRPGRGQATTEFVVALAALVPLFIGIAYAGRYMDIHHAAVQASRYASFQRVMQPCWSSRMIT